MSTHRNKLFEAVLARISLGAVPMDGLYWFDPKWAAGAQPGKGTDRVAAGTQPGNEAGGHGAPVQGAAERGAAAQGAEAPDAAQAVARHAPRL